MWRSRIRIFADGPVGCGYPGRMLTESTEFSPMPITSQRWSEAVIVAEYTAPAYARPLRARDETVRRAPRARRRDARRRVRRMPGAARTLRLRQDHVAPAARGARTARRRRDLDRRSAGGPARAGPARRRDGVPELRAVSASLGLRQRRLSPAHTPRGNVRDRSPGRRSGRARRPRRSAGAQTGTALRRP